MSKQDKATTERHAKTLRELLKRPENKVCADCKRNDPRWASWNLGIFLCIRCSGIHRSMGTHISKVKSVDLDVWTPEQMASVQKWGNRLANIYWEAHLRAGHVPADHKMESFIRSKYESRRWALEGPPPADPSTLESDAPAAAPESAPRPAQPATPPASSTPRSSVTISRQPQPHRLLSTSVANRAQQQQQAAAPAVPAPQAPTSPPTPSQPTAVDDLFSLDFHPPTASPTPPPGAPKADVKQNIMSLFSTPAQTAPAQGGLGQFAQAQPSPWGAPAQQQQPTSMMGNAGVGMWGASSGWSAPQAAPAQTSVWASANPQWGTPAPVSSPTATQQQQGLFATSDVWGSPAPASDGGLGSGDLFGSSLPTMQKKDDAFGDIWGGFK
ncbi:ArfGap-domain-containing protein [Obba rivulosa]|uniref:ArfGap-domain-containing protein n=1 Tax=Obba rivulosa TaxID=1052685 RepID=A0A8E2DR97_9APHY|nr:ArfGap-domain-containing protein [Obba rivulosa]